MNTSSLRLGALVVIAILFLIQPSHSQEPLECRFEFKVLFEGSTFDVCSGVRHVIERTNFTDSLEVRPSLHLNYESRLSLDGLNIFYDSEEDDILHSDLPYYLTSIDIYDRLGNGIIVNHDKQLLIGMYLSDVIPLDGYRLSKSNSLHKYTRRWANGDYIILDFDNANRLQRIFVSNYDNN